LRDIDPNKHAVLLPALLIRARRAAHSTVRDGRTSEAGTSLANGLVRPRSLRAPLHYRASNATITSRFLDTRSDPTRQSPAVRTGPSWREIAASLRSSQ
ncbi:MAG TPA: hypothetical protein VHT74_34105, partial [Acetobacteraceae bacterium]|nr:hypothetical protein [Acetobacteraceae bacterium]